MLPTGTTIVPVPATAAVMIEIAIATAIVFENATGTAGTAMVEATVTVTCATIDTNLHVVTTATTLFLPDLRKPTVIFAVLTRVAAIPFGRLRPTSPFAPKSLQV